jgi:hypothetical protein
MADEAWCAAAVLVFLQRAAPEEAVFYGKHHAGAPHPQRSLGDNAWERLIMHPDEDPTVGAIFAAISHPGALLRAATHRQFGLKRSGRIDLANHGSVFSRTFLTVCQVLEPIAPEIHLRPDQRGGMRIANCRDGGLLVPSLLVGSDVLTDTRAAELAFRLGKLLTMFRPERYLKLIYPTTTELRSVFLAGLRLALPGLAVPAAESAQIGQYAQRLGQSLSAPIRELLAKAALGLPRTGVEVYLAKWSQAVELTAHRAGLLVCNDLVTAARFIDSEPDHGTGLQSGDKIGELLRYSVSDNYFTLRRQLDLSLR